jgi:hypothetical protein
MDDHPARVSIYGGSEHLWSRNPAYRKRELPGKVAAFPGGGGLAILKVMGI